MPHPLFDLLRTLDDLHLWYRLDRVREDTVMVMVTAVGERLEIEVFDDGHVEYSRFTGSEAVEDDPDRLLRILRWHARDEAHLSDPEP